jgi:predicted NACHT family NTPase
MSPSPSQTEQLQGELASGQVVVVVGSGVSVAACGQQLVEGHKVATWSGLLEHGVGRLSAIGTADGSEEVLLTMIRSRKTDLMINAAAIITDRLKERSEGTFRGWLADTIGQLKIQDATLLQDIAALPGLVVTLNYDHLLEKATGLPAITWQETNAVQDALRGTREAILHLHGEYQNPESVVLGLSSYNKVKDEPHAKAVLQCITLSKTFLFVGCGDTVLDPNFQQLIAWGTEALQDVVPRHMLLCRGSELTAFQKKLAAAPWLQPIAYGDDYAELGPFLRSLVPAGAMASGSSRLAPAQTPSLDLSGYRQAMAKHYGHLKLEELDATSSDMPRGIRVTEVFIPPSVRECEQFLPRAMELPKELQRRLREQGSLDGAEWDEEEFVRLRSTYLDQSPQPMLELLADSSQRKLVVLGDPGSGKSLLFQYLVLAWAEASNWLQGDAPLPLLIELRDYASRRHKGEVNGFLDYLGRAESLRWRLDPQALEHWLRHNRTQLLLDGLDEVFDTQLRQEVTIAIHRFSDDYPEAQIVVSSRLIGFQHERWRQEGFRPFMLQELDKEQMDVFLRRWHQLAYEDENRGERKRASLLQAIQQSPAIEQLAGNPLLLTLMAILNRTQELPRDRAELYSQCTRLLLHQWKTELAFEATPELALAQLDGKDKLGLMKRIAWTLQAGVDGAAGNLTNLIEENQLERTLSEGLQGMPGLRPARAARALIEQLRGRNFMLCFMGGGNYAFVHRTFLEYFCAEAIVDRFQVEQELTLDQLKTEIFGHWPDETWHEVLRLVAGRLAPKFVKEILDWLLQQPDPNQSCAHIFLAARCVGELRNRGELGSTEARVRQATKDLVGFDLRYFYQPWSKESEQALAVCLQAVSLVADVWKDNKDTLPWLKERAQCDENEYVRQSAVEELARGWKEDPDTLAILKERAQFDKNIAVRQSAVEELARGWKEDPDTLVILKKCAQSDEVGSVRCSVVEELARGWKEYPDTLEWLIKCAKSDENLVVRRSAVEELARGWKEDPDTLAILKNCAQSDEAGSVRQSAVKELARGWKEDPDTLEILKKRAKSDEDEDVRQSAVEELARGWKEDPDTLAILKNCAQSDEAGSVRQSAVEELVRGWKEYPDTLELLIKCAKSDENWVVRCSAVKELARGWKEDPDTLEILKEYAKSDEDEDVRQSAVEELVRGWKEDPDTLAILKERAQSDESEAVRQSAVEELVRGWKDDPDTLAILKERAQSDESEAVRHSAVEELVRGWKDDPDTLAILKEPAQSDEDEDVRQSAVEELVGGWKEYPVTLAILKERAQSDEAGSARKSAMRELVRGWKDDPDTLAILKERAQSDGYDFVRQSAIQALARGWKDDTEIQAFLQGL